VTRAHGVERRRQFCPRCGQLMFEYYRSPDGHYGLAGDVALEAATEAPKIRCPACGALFLLLDRLSSEGQPIRRL
jgi:ribosomal protein S27AE